MLVASGNSGQGYCVKNKGVSEADGTGSVAIENVALLLMSLMTVASVNGDGRMCEKRSGQSRWYR